MRVCVLLVVALASQLGAQTISSVTDAASFGPRISSGSLATIFGSSLAASTQQASGTPLTTTLNGTSVLLNGSAVPLLYVSAAQINFQVPYATVVGNVTIQVITATGASAAYTATVLAQTPATFQYGTNHAVAQNADGTTNSTTNRAASGSVVTVYLTGLGAVNNPVADGSPAPSSPLASAKATVTATVGPQNAAVQFLGLTPGFIGLAQANIQLPSLPTGDYPLVITVGGTVSTSAVVSISGSGTSYVSPLNLYATAAFSNSQISSIALLGNVAYVCGANQITMVNVSNASSPSVIGSFGASQLGGFGTSCSINQSVTSPYLVDIVNPYSATGSVFTMTPSSLAIYDLTNATSPALLGFVTTQFIDIVSLSFNGVYGYANTSYFTFNQNRAINAQAGDLLAFNFASPGAPTLIGDLQPATGTLKPAAAVVNPVYAYISGSSATGGSTVGQGVLDVAYIGGITPVIQNQIGVTPADILLSFDVSGNLLLAAGNTSGNRNPGIPDFDFTGNLTLTTIDVSNLVGPVVLASFDTGIQVNGTFNTKAFGNNVFAIVNNPPATDNGGPASLGIVDARTPASPVLYPFQTEFGFSGMLATSSGFLLAPTIHGLNIYQLQF